MRVAPDKRKLSVNISVWLLKLKVTDTGRRKIWEEASFRKVADEVGQLSVKANKECTLTERPCRLQAALSLSLSPPHFAQMHFQQIGWNPNLFSPCER